MSADTTMAARYAQALMVCDPDAGDFSRREEVEAAVTLREALREPYALATYGVWL